VLEEKWGKVGSDWGMAW